MRISDIEKALNAAIRAKREIKTLIKPQSVGEHLQLEFLDNDFEKLIGRLTNLLNDVKDNEGETFDAVTSRLD